METTVVNIKMEECTIFIGRMDYPNHYGNPFIIGKDGSRKEVLTKFDLWIHGVAYTNIEPRRRKWIIENIGALRNKKLGCYCKPKPCHGDIYIKILNYAFKEFYEKIKI